MLQTRTLRSRGEVTGQGLPWVRVELGLEEGVRGGASSGFSEKSLTLKGRQVSPGKLSGWCHSVIRRLAPGPQGGLTPTGTAGGLSAQGAAPQEGGGLRERARGGNSCPGRAGLPELRWRDRLGSHSQEGK